MSIEQKQDYLRTQIVQAGYDPEDFYQFWQNFNIDLNDATMDDLTMVVKEFHNSKQTNKINDAHKQEEDNDQFGDFVQPEPNHNNFNVYDDFNWDLLNEKKQDSAKKIAHQKAIKKQSPIKQKKEQKKAVVKTKVQTNLIQQLSYAEKSSKSNEFEQSLNTNNGDDSRNINNVTFQEVLKDSKQQKRKCLKLQPNLLDHHSNLQILITKMEEITEENTGILNKLWKGTAQVFTIKTIGRTKQKSVGISWQVKRQYSDFQWLRNMLTRVYPGLVIPPLPQQTRTDNKIAGYQRKLQSFLLDCYYCPELRNSKYFEIFLSYSSIKDFQAFKKNSQSTSKPKNLTHILNMDGQLRLLFSQKIQDYSEGLQNFITKSSQHLKNVKSIIQQIDELYTNISDKYKKLGDVLVTMSEQSCTFSEEQCYPRLTETYKQISSLVHQHSQFCLYEKDFIQTYMFSHFAYEKDRIDNIQNLITKRRSFSMELAKPKHQSDGPKAEGGSMFGKIAGLFGEKTQNLDLPSADTKVLKEQVGFYNSQLMKQSIRCVQGMISSHVNHFSMYGHSRIDNMDSMQKIWSQVLVELSKLKAR